MLRPHRDVLTAQQAGRPPTARRTTWTRTAAPRVARRFDGAAAAHRHPAARGGCGAGLPRGDPDHDGPDDSVSDPRRTLAQAERRLRYVMERHGITRAGLKVVPHGLRHQDAADAYRSMTGQPPPVAGGGAVDAALDAQARQVIAEHLGHGRPAIVNAYLGRPHPGAKASLPAAHPNPDTRNPRTPRR
jgi:integrase